VAAQLGHPGLEGVAGAQRLIVEDHEEGFGRQDVVVEFAQRVASFEVQRHVEDGFDFLLAPVEQGDEVTAAETFGFHLNCTSLKLWIVTSDMQGQRRRTWKRKRSGRK